MTVAEIPGRLRDRLRGRADSEHEQAFTRLLVVPAMFAYMLWAPHPPERAGLVVLLSAAIFAFGLASALAVIAHILWRPAPNPARRLASMAVDVGGVGAGMAVGGVTSTVFFPILLWIILGYGFRFGRPYLFAAAGMSIAAFAGVLALSPEWRAAPFVGTALMLSLVILPAYFSVLLTRLTAAVSRAEEASRAKSHFVAAVSHEFRTPLNAVIGMGELLGTTRLSRDQADMVATIRAAAAGLLGLVNNVLDLAKMEAKRFTIDAEAPLDLHQALATVRHILLHAAAAKGLYLRQRTGPDVPYRLRGDGRAVQQVLLNLVGNAVKFTERGGIVVEVEAVERAEGAVRLRFEVRDTGLGLSPAAQARVFERFAQADETRRRVIGGTGLGLSIARELVELMGGTIGVTSAQGRGSRFWFEVPLAPAADGDAFEEPPRGGQVVVLGGRASATAAVGRLDRLGCRGRAVASVEAALQLARADAPPRVVLVTAHEPPVDVERLAAELGRRAGPEPVDLVTLGAGLGRLPELTLADLPEDADDAALLACLRAAQQTPGGGGGGGGAPAGGRGGGRGRGRARGRGRPGAAAAHPGGGGQQDEPEGDRPPARARGPRGPRGGGRPGCDRRARGRARGLRRGPHGHQHARHGRHRDGEAAPLHAPPRGPPAGRGAQRRRDARDAGGVPRGRVLGLPDQAHRHPGPPADAGAARRGDRPGDRSRRAGGPGGAAVAAALHGPCRAGAGPGQVREHRAARRGRRIPGPGDRRVRGRRGGARGADRGRGPGRRRARVPRRGARAAQQRRLHRRGLRVRALPELARPRRRRADHARPGRGGVPARGVRASARGAARRPPGGGGGRGRRRRTA